MPDTFDQRPVQQVRGGRGAVASLVAVVLFLVLPLIALIRLPAAVLGDKMALVWLVEGGGSLFAAALLAARLERAPLTVSLIGAGMVILAKIGFAWAEPLLSDSDLSWNARSALDGTVPVALLAGLGAACAWWSRALFRAPLKAWRTHVRSVYAGIVAPDRFAPARLVAGLFSLIVALQHARELEAVLGSALWRGLGALSAMLLASGLRIGSGDALRGFAEKLRNGLR